MSHRDRAKDRLGRHVFGWEDWESRGPTTRVHERQEEPEVSDRVPGEGIPERDTWSRRPRRGPDVGPHAPLLKRLVRYPYAMSKVRPVRVEGRTMVEPSESAVREEASIMNSVKEALEPVRSVGSVDTVQEASEMHRVSWRPHPFRKVRARGKGSS